MDGRVTSETELSARAETTWTDHAQRLVLEHAQGVVHKDGASGHLRKGSLAENMRPFLRAPAHGT